MSKVYIAGKITGLSNYKDVFNEVEKRLLNNGHKVMNPSLLGEGFPYTSYMPIYLAMIESCDTVCMIHNWEDSKGATLELKYAKLQGKKIWLYDIEGKFSEMVE